MERKIRCYKSGLLVQHIGPSTTEDRRCLGHLTARANTAAFAALAGFTNWRTGQSDPRNTTGHSHPPLCHPAFYPLLCTQNPFSPSDWTSLVSESPADRQIRQLPTWRTRLRPRRPRVPAACIRGVVRRPHQRCRFPNEIKSETSILRISRISSTSLR